VSNDFSQLNSICDKSSMPRVPCGYTNWEEGPGMAGMHPGSAADLSTYIT